ncbi:MAG: hypothetical protein Q8J63_02775 [Candidatus Aquicultor sp.]|nr:hypothetical protein [Candidatus Aquicultor sp.]
MQTSDHFDYMCTKWFSDGDVHKYFNAYERPHDAYIYFTNVLVDFVGKVDDRMAEICALQASEMPKIDFEAQIDSLKLPMPGIEMPIPALDLPLVGPKLPDINGKTQ